MIVCVWRCLEAGEQQSTLAYYSCFIVEHPLTGDHVKVDCSARSLDGGEQEKLT